MAHFQKEINLAKEAAARAAAQYILPGMLVGIGTGSTASYFIRHLALRLKEGFHVNGVATSRESHELAVSLGIPMVNADEITFVDIAVDGADEIDDQKHMIKGGGGALLREKIIASISKEMLIIADFTKKVKYLGKFPVPVEMIPFAYQSTIYKLEQLGYRGFLRRNKEGKIFITENGNYIFDIQLRKLCEDPEKENNRIRNIIGIVETGFFISMATKIIIGHSDGQIQVFE